MTTYFFETLLIEFWGSCSWPLNLGWLCDCFYSENMAEEMLHQFPGQALWDWQLPLLASWNPCFGKSQPLCGKSSCWDRHIVKKLNLGILRVHMGRGGQPEPGILAISSQLLDMWVKKSHLGCGQGPRTTARTEATKCPVQANSSPLSHRQRPQLSWGWRWRGASPSVPAWFPDPRNCVHQQTISVSTTKFWG